MKNKENVTIKSIIHCPTCNSECKVNSGTTQYYVPVKKYTEEDLRKAISEAQRSWVVFPNHNSFEDAQVEFMYNADEIIDLLTMKTKEEIEQETFEDYLIKNPYQDTRSFTKEDWEADMWEKWNSSLNKQD